MSEKKDVFSVTNEEYQLLLEQYSDLAFFQSWQLMRKNIKNNHTEDLEDIVQQLHMSLIRAGRYYKRQVYIETCLEQVEEFATDDFMHDVVEELKVLWANKTKHGANKKKFGEHQEALLEHIVKKYVPENLRPNINAPLRFDDKFSTYVKAISWNQQKSMGRKITRERTIRANSVSLSQYDYMGAEEKL